MSSTQPLVIDINQHIQFQDNKPSHQKIIDTPDLKLVMICMQQGQAIAWHRSNLPITVFVFRGEIDFGVRDPEQEQVYRLSAGMSLTLPAGFDHNLAAIQESVVLVFKSSNPDKSNQIRNQMKLKEARPMNQPNGVGCMAHGCGGPAETSYSAAIQQLFHEHPPLRQQMEQLVHQAQQLVERSGEQAVAEIQQLAEQESQFMRELEVHSEKEEQGLFPMLGRYIGTETGPIAVMEYEHSEAKRNLAEFERQVSQLKEPLTTEQLQAITAPLVRGCQILFEHFMKEENVLFPMAEKMLQPQEKEELLRIVEARN
jgi:regulator of cell morphogenesis and NO signaling